MKKILALIVLIAASTLASPVLKSECPRVCTQEINRVGGCDGEKYVLFRNPCLMKIYECNNNRTLKLVDNSLCKSNLVSGVETNQLIVESECPTVCTQEINRVCGYDGEKYVLFRNPCLMKIDECNNNRTLELVANSFCKSNLVSGVETNQLIVESECPRVCTQEINRVGGCDGEKYVLFSNPCLKSSDECDNNRTLELVDNSLCNSNLVSGVETNELIVESECPRFCTQEFNPVCGYDGEKYVLFSNPCLKSSDECDNNRTLELVDNSLCNSDESNSDESNSECPTFCAQKFSPVCAYDGEKYIQFPNECLRKSDACNNTRTLELVDTAFCSSVLVEDVSEYLGNVDLQKTECNLSCPGNLEPVCISNGKIRAVMSNQCIAESFNCLVASQDAESTFRIIKQDSC